MTGISAISAGVKPMTPSSGLGEAELLHGWNRTQLEASAGSNTDDISSSIYSLLLPQYQGSPGAMLPLG